MAVNGLMCCILLNIYNVYTSIDKISVIKYLLSCIILVQGRQEFFRHVRIPRPQKKAPIPFNKSWKLLINLKEDDSTEIEKKYLKDN